MGFVKFRNFHQKYEPKTEVFGDIKRKALSIFK